MRSPRRSLSRTSSIGFGTLFLAFTTYACSERAIAPTAADEANELALSGMLTSSLWLANGSQLTYAGSVSAQANITQDKNGVHQKVAPSIGASVSTSAPAQRFGVSQLQAPSTSKRPLPEGARVAWRTQLKSPRVTLASRDGKRLSMQRVADPRGGGRPPVATMLYDGDKPVSLIEGLYQKDGKRWKPTRARITIFGKDGTPSAVTENDFTALQTASVAMPGTAAFLADGFRKVGGTLSQLVQPDVLYAADPGDDGYTGCGLQLAAVIAAGMAQVTADIGLGIALTACGTTIISCPAVLAAMNAVAATAIVYMIKVVEYDQCMNPPPPPVQTRPTSNGSDGSNEGDGCYDVDWEISYDGGWSWSYYGTQRVCGHLYEM